MNLLCRVASCRVASCRATEQKSKASNAFAIIIIVEFVEHIFGLCSVVANVSVLRQPHPLGLQFHANHLG